MVVLTRTERDERAGRRKDATTRAEEALRRPRQGPAQPHGLPPVAVRRDRDARLELQARRHPDRPGYELRLPAREGE